MASSELRLDNYGRAKKNAEFVSIELDRLEGKIQALAEMAVNRQDPDFLSNQVDSAADSMRQTERRSASCSISPASPISSKSRRRFSKAICGRCSSNDGRHALPRRADLPEWLPAWSRQLADL